MLETVGSLPQTSHHDVDFRKDCNLSTVTSVKNYHPKKIMDLCILTNERPIMHKCFVKKKMIYHIYIYVCRRSRGLLASGARSQPADRVRVLPSSKCNAGRQVCLFRLVFFFWCNLGRSYNNYLIPLMNILQKENKKGKIQHTGQSNFTSIIWNHKSWM